MHPGGPALYRTRDAGESWEPLTEGLPQEGAFENGLRDGLDTDTGAPGGVYFGTRSDKLFATVAELFEALRVQAPAVYDRLLTEQHELRLHLNVFVDQEDIRWSGGVGTPLDDGSQILILTAVSGG